VPGDLLYAAETNLRPSGTIVRPSLLPSDRAQGSFSYERRPASPGSGAIRVSARTPVMLGPFYRWFTEGFNAPDLMDAKALLAELACGGQPVTA
jgi:hypothetical protein